MQLKNNILVYIVNSYKIANILPNFSSIKITILLVKESTYKYNNWEIRIIRVLSIK